ncbi:MAG TPA: hypothetical protein VGW10_09105 [Solirubrobacteraceae bacterium]|nr:hypothetical protein [Solirubrobacteraceae bacterium]
MLHSTALRALLAALAVTLLGAAPAGAQGSSAGIEAKESATGSMTISWRGDPARGCAEAGLCDVAGSVTFVASGGEQTSTSGPPTLRSELMNLSFQAGTPVVRVLRGPATDPLGACADPLGDGHVRLEGRLLPGGRARFTLRPFEAPFGAGTPAGRCAGPLAEDVVEALPSAEADASRVLSGTLELDFAGRRPFSGGPFSGEVSSSIRFTRRARRVARAFPGSTGSGPSPSELVDDLGGAVSLEALYDIVAARGSLVTDFAGGPEPFCLPLDACGLRGTHVVARVTARRGATLSLQADGPRSALRGRGIRAALRAVHAGRLRFGQSGFYPPLRGTVSTVVARDGGPACRQSDRLELPALALRPRRGALRLSIGSEHEDADSVMRSRCPGPGAADLAANTLAAGTIALRDVGARRITVRLGAGQASAGAFSVTGRGDVVLELRRRRMRLHQFGEELPR